MYLILDTSWSLPALDCSSSSWSCRTLMLLLMHFLPLRSYFLKFKIVLAMHHSLWMLLLTYLEILQDLLTKHESAVSQYLTNNYSEVCHIWIVTIIYPLISLTLVLFLIPIDFYFQFFEQYEKLLTSPNYVTRRQSLKVSSLVNSPFFWLFLWLFRCW